MKRLSRLYSAGASALLLLVVTAPGAQATSSPECANNGPHRACLTFGWKDGGFDSVEAVLWERTKRARAEVWAEVNGKQVVLCARRDTKDASFGYPAPGIDPADIQGQLVTCPWNRMFNRVRVKDQVHVRFWTPDGKKSLGYVHHELTR